MTLYGDHNKINTVIIAHNSRAALCSLFNDKAIFLVFLSRRRFDFLESSRGVGIVVTRRVSLPTGDICGTTAECVTRVGFPLEIML